MKNLVGVLIILVAPLTIMAQDLGLFKKMSFIHDNDTLLYRILYPKDYNRAKAYPVLTFLHGSGERGSDNEAQLIHGGSLFVNDTVRASFPAIVIFPQCPKDSAWNYTSSVKDTSSVTGRSFDFSQSLTPTVPAFLVKLLLDSLTKNNMADTRRMYIGGLSLGGFGTFGMIERYPDYFAAAVPICGGGDTTLASRFANKVAVWIFHGDKDPSVNVKYSREYYGVLKKMGADVRYTEYPGVGHNSWDNVFAEKQFLPWLLSKAKK